jgi:hypothetical protein
MEREEINTRLNKLLENAKEKSRTSETNNKSEKDDIASSKTLGTVALRVCANCDMQEPRARMYKKCQLCKEEGVKQIKFYCGKDCQAADWTSHHKFEHRKEAVRF